MKHQTFLPNFVKIFLTIFAGLAIGCNCANSQATSNNALNQNKAKTFAILYQNYKRDMLKNNTIVIPVENDNTIDLVLCDGFVVSVYYPTLSRLPRELDVVNAAAFAAAGIEVSLTKLGYPESVWGPDVAYIKRNAWKLGSVDTATERLVKSLNRYRRNSSNLPLAQMRGECGGLGGALVTFVPNRPGDQIWMIPQFWYQVCGKLRQDGVNPEDPNSCDGWLLVSDGQRRSVSGRYFVRTIGADGKSSLMGWDTPEGSGDHIARF